MSLPDKEQSYWRSAISSKRYTRLSDDLKTDVVIAGGGITGLTCAYLLKKAGLKVVVLEKNSIGSGTTGRTTGKVTSQHSLIYDELASRLGEKTAKLYGQANQKALDESSRRKISPVIGAVRIITFSQLIRNE
jgi:glycine/D-amino acid oxidase-like deaminating enzyme